MRLAKLVFVLLCATATAVPALQIPLKDSQGKTMALLLDCSSCKDGKDGKGCHMGLSEGFEAGKECGQCLLDANFGMRIGYPHDLHFVGKILDAEGKPVANKFVSVSLPNTWRIRTRTLADGAFRMMLGATMPKEKESKPLVIDLGTRTMSDPKAEQYSFFMLQEGFKPCQAKK